MKIYNQSEFSLSSLTFTMHILLFYRAGKSWRGMDFNPQNYPGIYIHDFYNHWFSTIMVILAALHVHLYHKLYVLVFMVFTLHGNYLWCLSKQTYGNPIVCKLHCILECKHSTSMCLLEMQNSLTAYIFSVDKCCKLVNVKNLILSWDANKHILKPLQSGFSFPAWAESFKITGVW